MTSLADVANSLSNRTLGILSVFLVSFANLSSIGIIAGAVKRLNEGQGNIVARFGLKLLYRSTLVSILTSIIPYLKTADYFSRKSKKCHEFSCKNYGILFCPGLIFYFKYIPTYAF